MFLNKIIQKCSGLAIYGERNIHTAAVITAARKGTRAKREAKKKAAKKEEIKKVFIPYKERLLMAKVGVISPRKKDDHLPLPVDDVFYIRKYRQQIFSVAEAIEMHREAVRLCQYNAQNADLYAHLELSMSADKKNKYIDEFSNIILLPYPYEVKQKRSILVLCEDEEMASTYRGYPGVELALGPECVKLVEKKELDFKQYDHILSHVGLLPELVSIRNHLRGRMPNVKQGTAGTDLKPLIERFVKGINYKVLKDRFDHDFGSLDFSLGKLPMNNEELEENLKAIIKDVESMRPTKLRSERLITLVTLTTKVTKEAFKIDFTKYLSPLEIDEDQLEAEN